MTIKAATIGFILYAGLTAGQAPASQPLAASQPPASPELNAIIVEVQRVAQSSNADLGRLRIEKWKADNAQKQQMQKVTESLQRNINNAIPGLISDLQADPNSVSKAFKLYHNLNVLYEFMSPLAEVTSDYGRKEEYEPLASDASALDKVRQDLSNLVEKEATALDAQVKRAAATPAQPTTTAQQQPKKIIVDNDTPPKSKKATKKKPDSNP